MKRFFKSLIITLLVGALATVAFGCDTFASNDNGPKTAGVQYKTVNGEKQIVGYVAESGEENVTITIDSDVKSIKSGAFEDNNTIVKIVVPATVEEIGVGAFKEMKALTELELAYVGASKTAVNEKKTLGYLFGTESYDDGVAITQNYGASSATYYLPKTLKKVTVNASSDYDLPAYAFYGCKNLTDIVLNGSVKSIGNYAFSGCYNITKIVIPQATTKIGNYAFEGCTRLNGKASTESDASIQFATTTNLTEIGSYAFVATRLVNVTLPEGLVKLGDHAFSSKVTGATLNDASKLQTIVLPSTLTEIDEYTFYFCEDLTTVTYGANLAKVWSNAFNYCSKITTFNTAGNTGISLVATVGANAFANCNLEASDLTNVGTNNVNEVLGK